MNIKIIEFEMNTCVKENEIFVVLYDETFIPEQVVKRLIHSSAMVKRLIHSSAMELYDYQIPSYYSCVFMTKETYNNVFKSLKGRV